MQSVFRQGWYSHLHEELIVSKFDIKFSRNTRTNLIEAAPGPTGDTADNKSAFLSL